MDTNAFASTGGAPTPSMTPATKANNGTIPGGISSVLQALMAGNNQYQQQQQRQAAMNGTQQLQNPATTTGGPSVGMPMPLSPQNTSATPGAMGAAPAMPANPQVFSSGASPVNIDPVTQALFSQVPGV